MLDDWDQLPDQATTLNRQVEPLLEELSDRSQLLQFGLDPNVPVDLALCSAVLEFSFQRPVSFVDGIEVRLRPDEEARGLLEDGVQLVEILLVCLQVPEVV